MQKQCLIKKKSKEFIINKLPAIACILQYVRFFYKTQLSKIFIGSLFIGSLLKKKKSLMIEVGAGDKKGENGWLTIDVTNNCDIIWDLRKGMPFPKNSISKIYSSHFMEHLSFKEGQQFLKECLRVLTIGGEFSICVPNAKLYIDAYAKGVSLDKNRFFEYKPAYNNTTLIDYVNYTAYMDGFHKYMFDEDNLVFILKAIGFTDVQLRNFDPSLDMKKRDYESIYALAIK
jgi:predicted SAM-dependent methyltransferase